MADFTDTIVFKEDWNASLDGDNHLIRAHAQHCGSSSSAAKMARSCQFVRHYGYCLRTWKTFQLRFYWRYFAILMSQRVSKVVLFLESGDDSLPADAFRWPSRKSHSTASPLKNLWLVASLWLEAYTNVAARKLSSPVNAHAAICRSQLFSFVMMHCYPS
jgi:hypothetical protein